MQGFSKIAPYLTHPLVLIGFVLLIVFGVHRAILKSGLLKPLSSTSSGAVVRLILHYGFAIALMLIVLGFALTFWRERTDKKPPLTRLSAEEILQRNRGNIENCLSTQPQVLFLDFAFSGGRTDDLGMDIVVGNQTARFDVHPASLPVGILPISEVRPLAEAAEEAPNSAVAFVTGDLPAYPIVSIAIPAGKLATVAPDANGCIVAAVRPSLSEFRGVSPLPLLLHRYITNSGVRASRMYSDYIGQYISFAIHDHRFTEARTILETARRQGYQLSQERIEAQIARAERGAADLVARRMSSAQFEALLESIDEVIYKETERIRGAGAQSPNSAAPADQKASLPGR